MDITGIDIAAVATLVGSIGTAVAAVVKAVQAGRKAEAADARAIAIELQREQAKKERDRETENLKTEVALLKAFKDDAEKRLLDGNNHFVRLEGEVKETNGLLREIIGALRNSGFVISKSPKLSRDSGLEL